jgi:hypothetical protein
MSIFILPYFDVLKLKNYGQKLIKQMTIIYLFEEFFSGRKVLPLVVHNQRFLEYSSIIEILVQKAFQVFVL